MTSPSRRRRNKRPTVRRVAPNIIVPEGPIDHTAEYSFVRYDLIRIVLLGGGLIGAMIVLSMLNLV